MRPGASHLDLLVPPQARADARRRLRHRGIAKALLAISAVVTLLFLAYVAVRQDLPRQEAGLFAASILAPLAGALFIRFSGRIALGLFLTNLAGIGIVGLWCFLTGGIASVALPWFLPNLFVLSTFGSRRMLFATAGALLAVLVALYAATARGWLPPSPVPASLGPVFALLSMLSSVALVVVVAVMLAGERETSKRFLREAKDAAEAASRAKSAFLTSMSHELRTPLNAVMVSGGLLKEDRDPPLSPPQVAAVDQILQGSQVLLDLVNQVIEYSAIEAGSAVVKAEPVALDRVLASALAVIAPLAQRQEVRISCDPAAGTWVMADPVALRSVLINLLSNAVKFNFVLGQVFVAVRPTPEGPVRIEVRDTGPGLPAALREAAFQPFNRLGAEGLHIEGAGLGLSIAERLVLMMAGRMGFSSVRGEGSTFWVDLPAAPAAPPEAPAAAVPASAEAPVPELSVLVAEDHPVNQQLLRRTLEKWGHRVTVVANGRLALEAIAQHGGDGPGFDLVLMDVLMPEMDGLEATRRIRQWEEAAGGRLPIVAVTACATDQDRAACFAAGMDGYLAKPFTPRDLAAILRQFPAAGLGSEAP